MQGKPTIKPILQCTECGVAFQSKCARATNALCYPCRKTCRKRREQRANAAYIQRLRDGLVKKPKGGGVLVECCKCGEMYARTPALWRTCPQCWAVNKNHDGDEVY